MVKELGKKYPNVTRDSTELFKSVCIDCPRKRVRPMTKGVVVLLMFSKELSWPSRSHRYAIVMTWFFQVGYGVSGPSYKVPCYPPIDIKASC